MKTALKITSCLSIVLALLLIYYLIEELMGGMSVFEIDFIPALVTLIIISNAVLAFYVLIGKVQIMKPLLGLQILIIIPTCLLIYEFFIKPPMGCS
ncbi:hypothetical protein KYG33_04660 [Chryseobacterium sp. D764]|jgi:hypothetical protein|uniref:hypothetical protein n=1 Tax=unclassified Chryseobacterium TaxID=2593645 RepID=UPI000984E190|nr:MULTISPECIES: hypothetical protein [unclassified Chryseobacterium]QXU50337.1 hypothetical protein KYG33_04660 [Chryseobacterium sp. D764]CAD0218803.1 conserved membrane protein of unknown function [Chryseobacterium sp. JV274]